MTTTIMQWATRGVMAALAVSAATPAGAAGFDVLHSFGADADGANPVGALAVDAATGTIYGTTTSGGDSDFGVLFSVSTTGHHFQVLHRFASGADGAHPTGSLALDGAGNVYGTTYDGGTNDGGTVFRLDAAGHYSVIASPDGASQGKWMAAGVAIGTDGYLYGAESAGANAGLGTLLRIDPGTGAVTVLHGFDPQVPAGGSPKATPLWNAGALTGTTYDGSVYRVRGDGTRFKAPDYAKMEWGQIYAGPTLGTDGTLWGVNMGGNLGTGNIWRISPEGRFRVVYSFLGDDAPEPHGRNPAGTMLVGADGLLYGTNRTAGYGQPSSCCGTVFRFDPATTLYKAHLRVVHAFQGPDGREPWAGLVADGSGAYYGVTKYGGDADAGVVYRIKP